MSDRKGRAGRAGTAHPRHAPGAGTGVVLPGPGGGDRVWPWWLQRQLDPVSPAWLPADLAGDNRTGRNWTVIGLPDGDDRWLVDRRGLLAPVSGAWALDWWVGAEDRWRLPSGDASVRQRLVDDAPVVETVVRVPGGEVVARHWAVPGDAAALVVMEIENASAAPVAVALSLRPIGPAGLTGVRHVAVEGGDLLVEGTVVLHADVWPRQSVVSGPGDADVASIVTANATPAACGSRVAAPSGWASAAMVWPLAHRATLQVESPGRVGRTRPPASPPSRARPGASDTARGWTARITRLTRLDLPPGPLAAALEAQRRHLLLAGPLTGAGADADAGRTVPGSVVPGSVVPGSVVAALSTAGLRAEAARYLETWLDHQGRDGRLGRDGMATASTLCALDVWARTGADDGLLARAPLTIARAAERLERTRPGGGPIDATWTVAGIQAAARLLARIGEGTAAGRAQEWGRRRFEALLASLAPGPGRFGPATEAALLAVVLGVLPARHAVAGMARDVARQPMPGLPAGAVAGVSPMLGLRPDLSLLFATSAAMAGEDPFEALGWVLSVASSTWTWPTIVAPHLGTGSHGSGHDPLVAAALWTCGRALLVADRPDDGAGAPAASAAHVDILPAPRPDWLGRGLEVHGLATAAGSLSYAIRWHGERPALLWEIDGPGPAPWVSASGLDPVWRGCARRGEALLDVVPRPDGFD